MKKIWRKYVVKKLGIVVSIVLDIILFIVYYITLRLIVKNGESVPLDIISNILLVGISVLSASLLSVPLIEVRAKNHIFKDTILEEVLSEPKLFEQFSREEKIQMLESLESNLYFENFKQKGEMLATIREKISSACGDRERIQNNCFFEFCNYEVECDIEDGYFTKTIVKSIDIRAYERKAIRKYPLCIVSSEIAEDGKFSGVESLIINGKDIPVKGNVSHEQSEETGDFNKRSGYGKSVKYYYAGTITAGPKKKNNITVTHKTRVPLNDVAFSCRLTCPCHKFLFRYSLSDAVAKEYNINVSAFGFVEDGKGTPNSPNTSNVKVEFNNWIFPMDGVSVTLIKKNKNEESVNS